MKKMLILMAVAAIPSTLGGCTTCCPTGLCPCCPCNWFNRGSACPPTYAAPVVAAPVCPPTTVAPMPQYVTPLAAPVAAAAPCAAPCSTWNPCQGVVSAPPMIAQPTAATCCPQQAAQPMFTQAQPAYYAEPSCGFVESSCGAPFEGMVSYGPEMPVEYGPTSGSCCEGGAISPTPESPDAFVEPRPAAE